MFVSEGRKRTCLCVWQGKHVDIVRKKIKEISEDVVVTKAKLKKLIISHKVKRYNNWKKPFVKNNKKIKIYYRGKKIH